MKSLSKKLKVLSKELINMAGIYSHYPEIEIMCLELFDQALALESKIINLEQTIRMMESDHSE